MQGHANRDEQSIGAWGATLFLLTFLFFWVGTNPYVNSESLIGVEATAGNSNRFNQIAALGLTIALLIYGLRSEMRQTLFRPRLLLALLFIWLLFTSAISAHPDIGVRRVILAVMTCLNASVFLLLPRSERQLVKLLAVGSLIALGFAYFGVFALPTRAIHQATDVIEPMLAGAWRGQYAHKNAAAVAVLLLVFFGLYIRSMGQTVLGIIIVVLATVFLIKTGGKTSAAMLPFIIIIAAIFEKWKWSRFFIGFAGLALFNFVAVGSAVITPLREFISSLGIDATFTNRADIWRLAFSAITERPWTGYGMDGFWKTEEMIYSGGGGANWAVAAFNGHNSSVDALLTAGIPCLILLTLWMTILPIRSASAAFASGNNIALTRLFTRIWLYGIYMSNMETIYLQSGGALWFALMFAVFSLHLQATACLKSEANSDRNKSAELITIRPLR